MSTGKISQTNGFIPEKKSHDNILCQSVIFPSYKLRKVLEADFALHIAIETQRNLLKNHSEGRDFRFKIKKRCHVWRKKLKLFQAFLLK
jgi:hypothetical protein